MRLQAKIKSSELQIGRCCAAFTGKYIQFIFALVTMCSLRELCGLAFIYYHKKNIKYAQRFH